MAQEILSCESLRGTWPAIVTPFSADGSKIDLASFERLLNYQLKHKVDGVVVCGSTGEGSTISSDEYRELITASCELIGQRGKVIAAIGGNSTSRAVEQARFLDNFPVAAILLVSPPYNKPQQRGIVEHFRHVKSATRLPIIAYNIPGRTAVNILPATLAQMFSQQIIIGVKEASGSIDQMQEIREKCGNEFALLSGEDSLVHVTMALGGRGVISASANLIPEMFVSLVNAAEKNDFNSSLRIQLEIMPFFRALFRETNPVPVKAALHLLKLIDSDRVREPLAQAEDATLENLTSLIKTIRI